jgi:DNA mismatch repair protein MutS
MGEASNLTPMFRQYRSLKQEQPESILLFRMGDFYEMFFEDAKIASRLLELTLTARGRGTDSVVPMCGFPHHQLDAYTGRLVRANRKVAICDQVEDPKKAKGLVRREIVRVVTPGTVNDPAQLDAKSNLWITSVVSTAGRLGAAFLDASTGEFLAWETAPDAARPWEELAERLKSFAPREIVYPEELPWEASFREAHLAGVVLTPTDPFAFSTATASATLEKHLAVASLDGFGLRDRPAAVAAGAGLLLYVQETQRCAMEHIDRLLFHEPARYLLLDPATRRNLELDRSLRDGRPEGSLFHAIDTTVTAAGGRRLRRWLLAPLLDPEGIARRHEAVAQFLGRPDLREPAREQLKGVHDIERLLARAVAGTAGARDLLGLKSSLDRLPGLRQTASAVEADLVRETVEGLDPCEDVAQRIGRGIVDEPPANLRDGGFIRDGFDADLDELRTIRRDGRSFIASLEAKEREATRIASLKVRFNKVFGYFIEVTKANLHLVPDHYQRKQTIANGERYITPELKECEAKILQAQERIEILELELFRKLRAEVAAEAVRLKAAARGAALLDVLASFAESAAVHGYCRPSVDRGRRLRIVSGRHPVVEQTLRDTRFVPNDTEIEWGGRALAVLTGPNMGGKSTYLRQVALITLMAQAGSFVPAEQATVGVVDRIFCRVGASDSLAEGQSTFMVEMTETANILYHATSRSLILLDEIGRGTSTFDGLSIAWAVVEHLDGVEPGTPRCLFATHYHELTELARELGSVINLRMAVRESGDTVAFLHRVERGSADRSYGIHVARLAGIPRAVVERANEILANIERDEFERDGSPRRARRRGRAAAPPAQPSLFGVPGASAPAGRPLTDAELEVLEELRRRQPDRMTPIESLSLLSAWREKLRADEES